MNKIFKVQVNETFQYELESSDSNKLDLIHLSASKFNVLHNKKSFNLNLLNSNFNSREYSIQVNANNYNVKISHQLDDLIKEMGFSSGLSKKNNDIKAPMPGIILSVLVKENQEVKEGDTLFILEAMKMENAITSPKNATIKNIYVKATNTVDKGQLLIELV